MMVLARLLLLVFGVLLVNFHLALRQGEFAAPLSVTLADFASEEIAHARLFGFYVGGNAEEIPPKRPGYWECPPRCTVELVLRFSEPTPLTHGLVHIQIGDHEVALPMSTLELRGETYWLTEKLPMGAAPTFASCRNWPGTPAFLAYFLKRSTPGLATIFGLALVVSYARRSRWQYRFLNWIGLFPSTASGCSEAAQEENNGHTDHVALHFPSPPVLGGRGQGEGG